MNSKQNENDYWIGDSIELNKDDLELLKKLNYNINSNKPIPSDIARILIWYKIYRK